MRDLVGVLLGAALLLPGVASAAGLVSDYTDVDIDQCTLIESDDTGAAWACPGLRGYPLMIAEGDLRMFVSFGLNPGVEKAAEQTLPPFNRLGAKLEWLHPGDDATAPPVATILRWYTQRETGEAEGQVLVVTQILPGATCHIAYIDALAVKNANEAARQIANETAGRFDCAEEPEYVGKFEAWDVE